MTTIKDVAKEAGVSTSTVSRVINKKDQHLSDITVSRVNEAMKKLNYRPNTVAQSLVRGRYNSIGVIIPSLKMPFWAQMVNELEKAAALRGYSIIVMSAQNENYEKIYEGLRGRMSDGIITSCFSGTLNFVEQALTPTVIIGNADNKHCVSSNDAQGGLLAARHMIAKGCKKIIHISGRLDLKKSSNERSFAFIKECEKRNIDCKVYQATAEQLREMDFSSIVNTVFYENDDFDGIFASNDILAAHCIAMAKSLGYQVPEDIKIVGYDDINISSLIYPALTTIHQDYKAIAETAIDTLIKLINNETIEEKQIIPVELIERKTT